MGIVEATYAEIKQQELKKNPYSCLSTADIDVNPHQVEAFTFSLDSDKSLVSSANLSYHGLSGNIEMGFLVRSADKAKQIEELLKELVRMHVYKKIS